MKEYVRAFIAIIILGSIELHLVRLRPSYPCAFHVDKYDPFYEVLNARIMELIVYATPY